jgi:hypothetical protein
LQFATALELPPEHHIPFNMEKSVYNWAVRRSKLQNDPPGWDSPTFKDRYKLRYSSIMFNIKESEEFRQNLLNEVRETRVEPRWVLKYPH